MSTFILHKAFGLGYVVKNNLSTMEVKFPFDEQLGGGKLATRVLTYENTGKFYNFIEKSVLLELFDKLVALEIPPIYRKRGEEYAQLGTIKNFKYDKVHKLITCSVIGNDTYNIKFPIFRSYPTCSCPVQDNTCKHLSAFKDLLLYQLDVLDNNGLLAEHEKINLEETKNHVKLFLQNPYGLDNIHTFFDALYDARCEKTIESYLIYLNTIKPGEMTEDKILQIFDMVCVISKLSKDKFLEYLNAIDDKFVKHTLLDEYARINVSNPNKNVTYKNIYEVSFPYMMLSLIQNEDVSKALYFYMVHEEFRDDLRSKMLFENVLKDSLEDEYSGGSVLYSLLNRQTRDASQKRVLLPFVEKTSLDAIPFVAKQIPFNLYHALSVDFLIKALPYLEHKSSALTIISDKYSTFNDQQISALGGALALCFEQLTLRKVTPKFLQSIRDLYKRMPQSEVLDSLLNEKLLHYDFMGTKEFTGEDKIVLDNYFKGIIDPNSYQQNRDENFFKYFKVSMFVSPIAASYYYDTVYSFDAEYRINDIYGRQIFYLSATYSSNDSIHYRYLTLGENIFKDKELLYWFLNFAEKSSPAEVKQLEENKEKLLDILYQKEDNILLEQFDIIEKENVDKIAAKLSNKAQIEIELHFMGWQYNDSALLFTIKVGNTRMYQVPNAISFLSYFDRNENHRYGKNLAFYHKRENLTDHAKKVYDILNLYSKTSLDNPKYFIFSKNNFIKIMDMLKDTIIYYLDRPYLNTLDDIKDRVVLTKDYKLNFYAKNKCYYFKTNNCLYAFDQIENTIHFTDDYSKATLINFGHDYAGSSLKRVKDAFIQKVYPLVANNLEIDGEIRDEFKLSDLTIKSYFDFANDVISLKTKYVKGDRELTKENISILNDVIKTNQYLSLMDKLGFNEEGKMEDDDDILNFLSLDFAEIQKITEIYLSDSLSQKQLAKFNPPHAKMTFENNLMSVFFNDSEYSNEELYEILSAIKKKKKYVLLKGNHIVTLDGENGADFLELVESLNLDKKHLNEENHAPVYQSLAAFNHLDLIELDDHLEKMVNDIKNFKQSKFKIPAVNADVRTYQKEGFKWLKILSDYQLGGILADDMGLGKTLEIIMLLANDKSNEPSLIVAPKSLVFNWYSEFNKFLPDYDVKMIYGDAQDRSNMIKNIKTNKRVCYLTSYDSLRNDIESYDMSFNYLVLDEAQVIKNVHALKSQMVKKVEAKHRFALTGTPIENDIFDLWSIFDFLMPNYMPGLSIMKSNANEIGFQDMIAKRVAPFILRRTKKEVLKDLPQKFERVITAEMTKDQRKLYDATCLQANTVLNEGGKPFDVLYLLTRLRQICVDPRTFVENYTGESGKTEMLKELINEYINNGHRILIFSQFVTALNIIEEYLKKAKIKYYVITGKTDAKERIELVNSFNSNSEIKVFLISLKAGGNGLNLVGADTVIHYDPWWNVAAENQATDRAYRIGQKRNVEVIRLIASNSIEQRVIELQNKKKDLIDRLISNDTSSIEKVSIEDLKFILN